REVDMIAIVLYLSTIFFNYFLNIVIVKIIAIMDKLCEINPWRCFNIITAKHLNDEDLRQAHSLEAFRV
ncbi:hypothetical protein ACJX0J_028313, partial [Zea mays]